jgi:ring-1,2-phenylacetyl-CoA epoxidase subunit PaaB
VLHPNGGRDPHLTLSFRMTDDQRASTLTASPDDTLADSQWELWEVFTQEAQGAPHEHAGSLRATDAEHALQNARDVYGRRGKVISVWVVPTAAITASTPGDAGPFFEPGADKAYRHPQFYKVPRGVRGV